MKHSPELLVYKASAGSGKTFTLAVEYIKLLIQNPEIAADAAQSEKDESRYRVYGGLLS